MRNFTNVKISNEKLQIKKLNQCEAFFYEKLQQCNFFIANFTNMKCFYEKHQQHQPSPLKTSPNWSFFFMKTSPKWCVSVKRRNFTNSKFWYEKHNRHDIFLWQTSLAWCWKTSPIWFFSMKNITNMIVFRWKFINLKFFYEKL